MRYNKDILKIIKDKDLTTKIYIYMSSKSYGDDYDPYEDNVTFGNLNPLVIKGYVRELTGETAFYKGYGIHQSGILEILCEEKWRKAFEHCNKIVINDIEYQVFKDAGGKVSIIKRSFRMIRVTVARAG